MDFYALLPLLVFVLILVAGAGRREPMPRSWLAPYVPPPPPDYSGLPLATQVALHDVAMRANHEAIKAMMREARRDLRRLKEDRWSVLGILRWL